MPELMLRELMHRKIISVLIFFVFILQANAQQVSFSKQNKNKNYISFSFGMGASYSNNPSLKTFIGYEIPNYPNLYEADKLSDFSTGFEFFGGTEIQLKKNLAVKGEYSYFTKTMNVNSVIGYDFTYESHQPYLVFNYLIPQENSFVKLGAGVGFIFSTFNRKYYSIENRYTSIGLGLKSGVILNMQVGNNFSVYIDGNVGKTFQPALKDSGGNVLKNINGDEVNLSSLIFTIRLGVEIFVFKL